MTIKYSKDQLSQTGIYAIVHRESGKRYIGSAVLSFKRRWSVHKSELRKGTHHSPYLQNAWDKYSKSSFDFVILEFVPPEYCIQREQWWMDLFGSYLPENGYNTCLTAGSKLGLVLSEEHKRKISAGNKGRVVSEETREKLSKSHTGKVLSKESIKKRTESRCKNNYRLIDRNGVIFTSNNLAQFARENNLNSGKLYDVLKGNQSHHKGYRVFLQSEAQ